MRIDALNLICLTSIAEQVKTSEAEIICNDILRYDGAKKASVNPNCVTNK